MKGVLMDISPTVIIGSKKTFTERVWHFPSKGFDDSKMWIRIKRQVVDNQPIPTPKPKQKKKTLYNTNLCAGACSSCSVHWSPSFTSIIASALSTAARQATGPRVAEVMWVFSAYFMSKYWYFYFLGTYKWLFKVPKGPWNLPLILWIFLNFGHLGVHHSSDPLLGSELSAVNEAGGKGTAQNWFCPEKNQLTGYQVCL